MKKNIQSIQITHAAVVIILTTSLLTKTLYIYAKNDAGIAVIAASCLTSLIFLIYTTMTRKFQGLNLLGINEKVFGRVLGKVISSLYVYFFFTIAALNVNIMGSFVKGFVLLNTPTIFVLLLFVMICVSAARKGSQNIVQYSFVFSLITIVIILINALMLYKNYHLKNLLPLLTLPAQNYIVGIHSVSIIPLCDPIVLLMFIPDMRYPAEFGKAIFKGLLLGSFVLLLIVFRDIAVLGPSSAIVNFPSYLTIRMIDIGDVFTRVDIIYVSVLISLMFYKVSIFYCAAVSGVQQLFGFDSYKFMLHILGGLLIICALTVFPAANEHSKWLINGAAAIHNTFFVVFLPLLTLTVAVVRGFHKKTETAAQ